MEIHLLITVHTKDNTIVLNYSKTYHSNMVPSVGSKIKDSLFAKNQNIIEVVLDYSKEECYVTLEPKVETKERLGGHIQEVAELHKWVLLS
jgi:hypothetical protein